jgi:uncharacterized protein (DUF3084 family)
LDVGVIAILEALVWTQIEGVLDKPEGIVAEIERQRKDANQLSVLETELGQVVHQLKGIDNEQTKLLQWALKGFPEDRVMAENKKLNAARENLKVQKTEIETRIKFSQEAGISLPKLQDFVELVRKKLTTLDFETKRMAVEMLNIKVWIDGKNVEITGSIPMEEVTIVNTQS